MKLKIYQNQVRDFLEYFLLFLLVKDLAIDVSVGKFPLYCNVDFNAIILTLLSVSLV